jgi:urease subunit alpha
MGDRVRLGDSNLWIRVAEDRQAPGDEAIWGYAKTIRPRALQGPTTASELDVLIAGALVLDPLLGAVKADIGVKDGRIVAVGRAGPGREAMGSTFRSDRTPSRSWGTGSLRRPGPSIVMST